MDVFTARVQAALTLMIVGAWILLLVLSALGRVADADYSNRMMEVVMLAVGFWLLRARPVAGDTKAEDPKPPKPAPETPP